MFRKDLLGTRTFQFILSVLLLSVSGWAQIMVDCTATDPSAFVDINSAISVAGPGAFILIEAGPCDGPVNIQGQTNLWLGPYSGQQVAINGGVAIQNSQGVYVYGLVVTNPAGDGLSVAGSRSTILDTCSSNGNSGTGLHVGSLSDVAVNTSGSFDHNGNGGVILGDNSFLTLNAWGGPIDISYNTGAGIYASRASVTGLGNITITNNSYSGPLNPGLGIDLRGAATAQFGGLFGPNLIQNNPSGGVSLQENAEISFWTLPGGFSNTIQSNGPVGVKAGFGSQVTLYDGTQVMDHTAAGVDVFANSQAYFFGHNQIMRNGTTGDPLSAGIRADGNSEVFMRGGEISLNNGPAMLGLVNSSFDFTGGVFASNANGIITCDSTSTMVSDLVGPTATPPAGVRCKVPHLLGNRILSKLAPAAPDLSRYKALHAKYQQLFTKR